MLFSDIQITHSSSIFGSNSVVRAAGSTLEGADVGNSCGFVATVTNDGGDEVDGDFPEEAATLEEDRFFEPLGGISLICISN